MFFRKKTESLRVKNSIADGSVVFLYKAGAKLKQYKTKSINCPLCKKKVGTYDGRATINIISNCKKCKKRIVYHPETGLTEAKPIPPRYCSSGYEFR